MKLILFWKIFRTGSSMTINGMGQHGRKKQKKFGAIFLVAATSLAICLAAIGTIDSIGRSTVSSSKQQVQGRRHLDSWDVGVVEDAPVRPGILGVLSAPFESKRRSRSRHGLEASGYNCDYFASKSDLDNAGLTKKVEGWCANRFGKKPDGVLVNDDGYPYKTCVDAGEAEFSSMNPKKAAQVIATDTFHNPDRLPVKHTFSLSGSQSSDIKVQTTNTIHTHANIKHSINIPKVFHQNFTMNESFSTDTTESHSDFLSTTYTTSVATNIPPSCSVTASLKTTVDKYAADIKVPICITGYVGCHFGEKVEDPTSKSAGKHFYWYMTLDQMGLGGERWCWMQKGELTSSVSMYSTTSVSQSGKCGSEMEE